MDEVDTKQQIEITDLQKKDILHDNDLKWLRDNYKITIRFLFFAFSLWIVASTTIIFVLVDKLDKYLVP